MSVLGSDDAVVESIDVKKKMPDEGYEALEVNSELGGSACGQKMPIALGSWVAEEKGSTW